MRPEAAGDPGPWRQRAILGRGQWDADALRDLVREYALETLGDEDAVLVIDETGFADELLICEFAVWFLTPRAASPQTCIIPTCTIMDL
jgi:hypothetical protein